MINRESTVISQGKNQKEERPRERLMRVALASFIGRRVGWRQS